MADVQIDTVAIIGEITEKWQTALYPLSEQILTDCNEFVRMDTGQLKKSSATASDPKKGVLVWDTPYARRVYYTGTPSTDVNPNASLMWVEKAKAAYINDWTEIAAKLVQNG